VNAQTARAVAKRSILHCPPSAPARPARPAYRVGFPRESVDDSVLIESSTHTTCPWKGQASYYSLVVDGETNRDAAWFYETPKSAAAQIAGRVAFWRGVTVTA
jgi:uncharacterized protein (DUF427 family)